MSGPGYQGAYAKLCMGNYADGLVYYKGLLVYQFGPSQVSQPQTSAYITMASNGDVLIYQYSGGPVLFVSNTTTFAGARLDVSSCTILPYWNLSLDKPGSFYWNWKGHASAG